MTEANQSDSFIRWQAVTREQFTLVSNVVLGLTTGLLAFTCERLLLSSTSLCSVKILGSLTVILLGVSIGLGLWCSINRLSDFRATAQIARKRDGKTLILQDERSETKILGERSWEIFRWQLILFGVGTGLTVLVFLIRIWS